MRIKRFTKYSLSLVMVLLIVLVLASCEKDPEPEPENKILTGITLDISDVKTVFEFGETFSYEGLKVSATFDDESTEDVPLSDVRVSTPDTFLPGKRVVNVSYRSFSDRYQITVKERVVPEIGIDKLLDITEINLDLPYRVEAENIDMLTPNVKAKTGSGFVKDGPENIVTSNDKYLYNYGVKGNYFGFKFDSAVEKEDAIIVMRVGFDGSNNLSLKNNLKAYLNYGTEHLQELSLEDLVVEVGDEEQRIVWKDLIFRNIHIYEGENELTFDVLGELVPLIDYIDFYVGARYINSVVEMNGKTTVSVEFEDFDIEKVVTRQDFIDAGILKPGELKIEHAHTNEANTSGGHAVAGFTTGSEFSTTIRTSSTISLKFVMRAASVAPYAIADNWEFYLNGVLLENVEYKDIRRGDPGKSEWWMWEETNLGTYEVPAGDNLLTAKVTGAHVNIDNFLFINVTDGEVVVP